MAVVYLPLEGCTCGAKKWGRPAWGCRPLFAAFLLYAPNCLMKSVSVALVRSEAVGGRAAWPRPAGRPGLVPSRPSDPPTCWSMVAYSPHRQFWAWGWVRLLHVDPSYYGSSLSVLVCVFCMKPHWIGLHLHSWALWPKMSIKLHGV